MIALATSVCVVLGVAGCLDALGPDVGPLQQATCDPADSDPAVDVQFGADILDGVFAAPDIDCDRCHTDDGEGVRQSGFDTSSYTTVRAGGGRSGAAIVVDGDACASILVQKLGTSPPFGARMPRDGPPYLTPAAQQQVADWIVEGARDN